MENSITSAKADFIIDKQDYRESIRQAAADQLLGLIGTLAKTTPKGAEVAFALLDLLVDLMDALPNKEEAVARIRKINQQHAPEDEMTPEEKQEMQKKKEEIQKEAEFAKQLQHAMGQVKVAKEQSAVQKNLADAAIKKLEGFIKALEVAGVISTSPQLVQAADALAAEAQKIGAGSNQNQDTGGPQT